MSEIDDIDIPNAWEGEEPEGETVLSLTKWCKERVAEYAMRHLSQAEFNERMVIGDQFIEVSEGYEVQEVNDWPNYVPRTSRNLLRNLSLTWSSRLLEDSPWVSCYASAPGTDENSAAVATRILENCRQMHDFESMQFDAAQLVQMHTAVAFKTVWDPLRGPPSPGTPRYDANGMPEYNPDGTPALDGVGHPTGDVSWETVSVFDYGTDGAEHIEDSRWCYFVRMMDLYDAKSILAGAGMETDIAERKYRDIWGTERAGVEVVELWWRPDARFPQGLYAIVVADRACQVIPYPYKHNELPLAVWKCGARRNSPYGSSHVDDAVYIQRCINETVAALTQQARQIGAVKLVGPSSFIDAVENGNQMIPMDDPQQAASIRYIEPPPRSSVLVDTLTDNTQALYAIYGLNEMLTGADNVKSGTSAKSIAYLNKLDSMKSAGASRSLNKAVLRICRQTLKLYQQYVQAPRLAQVAGESTLVSAQQFLGADLMGVDVRIEPASAKTQMRGEVAGEAQQAMAAGNPDPALKEVSKTGIADTAFAHASRDIARAQAQAALRGEPQQPDPEVDPTSAISEIMEFVASNRGNPNMQVLQTLLQGYQSKVPAPVAAPPGPAPKPQAPGPPPGGDQPL